MKAMKATKATELSTSISIVLKLTPTSGDDSIPVISSLARKMIKNNQKRVKQIVEESLYGSQISNFKLSSDYSTVSLTVTPTPKYIGMEYVYGKGTLEQLKDDLIDNYGNGASDGWMEGDISFPGSSWSDDSKGEQGELFLDLL